MEERFEFPILTVDGAIFQLVDDELTILLIQRAFEPFLGEWALPGEYIPKDRSSRQALEHLLVHKTGISTKQLRIIDQPYAFDSPARDPRGYAVTVMYIGLGRGITPGMHPHMDNGQNPQLVPISKLPKLAYDHQTIVKFALDRLKALSLHTAVVATLLPKDFTFLQLQTAYEAIFGKTLDKRNFRKKMLSLQLLEPTSAMTKDGAHRPAQLYRFHAPKSTDTANSFA
jgi:8-oxo-dGTP diphosphatase